MKGRKKNRGEKALMMMMIMIMMERRGRRKHAQSTIYFSFFCLG